MSTEQILLDDDIACMQGVMTTRDELLILEPNDQAKLL